MAEALENTLRPAPERARRAPETEEAAAEIPNAPPADKPRRILEAGDLPETVKRIYVAEPAKYGAFIDYFAGADAKAPAFRDHGKHLATERSDPAIVRHLVEIAVHRGWTEVQVRGSDEFRREIWREATAEGLKVRGYSPTERDRVAVGEREPPRPAGPRERPANDLDAGVEGRLVETGRAPYRHQPGARETPYIRLDQEGRSREIWGTGLPDALARSGVAAGEEVRVRRVGPGASPREPELGSGEPEPLPSTVRRTANQWVIERAERFLKAEPAEAAKDPELRGAQSHLRLIEVLARERLPDAESRARVVREAKALIAEVLREGAAFRVAEVEEVQRRTTLVREPGRAAALNRSGPDGPERTRQR